MKKFIKEVIQGIQNKKSVVIRLEPEDVFKKIQNKEGVLLDVRNVDEFEDEHIKGAINIPLHTLEKSDLNSTETYYCICKSGARSMRAIQILQEKGIDIIKVKGGMLEWNKKGLPVVKK